MVVEVTETNANLLFQVGLAVECPLESHLDIEIEAKLREMVKEFIARKDTSRAFLFSEGDRAVGFIAADLDDKWFPKGAKPHPELVGYGHVAKIGVIPEQGPECALLLIGAVEDWLKSRGTKGAWLDYLPYGGKKFGQTGYSRLGYAYSRMGYIDIDEFADSRDRTRRIAVKHW